MPDTTRITTPIAHAHRTAWWEWAAVAVVMVVWGAAFHAPSVPITRAGAITGAGLAGVALLARREGLAGGHGAGRDWWWALPVLAAHLAVSYLAIPIATAIIPVIDDQASVLVASATSDLPPLLVAAFSALVVVPMEEYFWRATLQDQLRPVPTGRAPHRRILGLTRASWQAVAVTTAIYCGFNVVTGNIPLVGASLLGGIAWGWLRERTGGLAAPVIAHAGWTATMALAPPA